MAGVHAVLGSKSKPPLVAVVDTPAVFGVGDGTGSQFVETDRVFASATGGTPPYTYSWTISPTAVINSASSADTTFKKFLATGASYNGTATVTVTDAASAFDTETVSVGLTN